MRGIATLLVGVLLTVAGCGKYGPPVRHGATAAAVEAPTRAGEPAENTHDEEPENQP